MTRIRNWPWAYIGRRWLFAVTVVVGVIPWVVGFLLLFIACMAWGLSEFLCGGSFEDATAWFLIDDGGPVDRWLSIPDRLWDWVEAARPKPEPTGFDLAALQAIASLQYQQLIQQQAAAPVPQPGVRLPSVTLRPGDLQRQSEPPIPDDPNPVLIRGWRSYQLDADILQGMTAHCWAGANMKAQCYVRAFPKDLYVGTCEAHLRAGACHCGIYVLKERPDPRGDMPVLAEVVGWGAYVEYERGWRCQYVRIERLFIPDTAGALRERYRVPVELTPMRTTEEG